MDQPTLTAAKHVRARPGGRPARWTRVFEVRALTRRQKRNGEPFLKLQLGDVTGAVEGVAWESVDEIAACAKPGSAVHVTGRFAADSRYGPSVTVRALRAARAATSSTPPTCSRDRRIRLAQMAAALDELIGTVQDPHLRELLRAPAGRGLRDRRPLARRARGQGLPPGLPARAARALAVGGPGRERHGGHLPRHRPRRGGHRRAAARHRQDRGLRADGRGDRAIRRRQAPGRDPAGLLPGAARDRLHRRLPARHGARPCCTSCSATTASSSTAAP